MDKKYESNDIVEIIENKVQDLCIRKGIDFSSIKLDENFDFNDSGLMDSLEIVEFILYLQTQTNKTIDISEMDPEEFTNYSNLISLFCKQEHID